MTSERLDRVWRGGAIGRFPRRSETRRNVILAALFVLATVGLLAAALGASAQPSVQKCDWRDRAVASLKERFDETVRALALAENGRMFELLGVESGSWASLVPGPDGWGFSVVSGGWFQLAAPATPEERS